MIQCITILLVSPQINISIAHLPLIDPLPSIHPSFYQSMITCPSFNLSPKQLSERYIVERGPQNKPKSLPNDRTKESTPSQVFSSFVAFTVVLVQICSFRDCFVFPYKPPSSPFPHFISVLTSPGSVAFFTTWSFILNSLPFHESLFPLSLCPLPLSSNVCIKSRNVLYLFTWGFVFQRMFVCWSVCFSAISGLWQPNSALMSHDCSLHVAGPCVQTGCRTIFPMRHFVF